MFPFSLPFQGNAMADDEILDEEGDEELNIVAIAIAALVVLALIGGGVWFFFLRETPEEDIVKIQPWEPPEGLTEEVISSILPKMIINPADSKGRYFLIVKINVAMNDPALVREQVLDKLWRLQEIKNIINDIFSVYTMGELKTPKVKEEARQQVKEALNDMMGWTEGAAADGEEDPPPIKAIYFEEYILQ